MDQFKEQVVFELEKDKPFDGLRQLRKRITKEYGYNPTTELLVKINNYQIEKYGGILSFSNHTDFIKNIKESYYHKRHEKVINRDDHRQLESFIKRNL